MGKGEINPNWPRLLGEMQEFQTETSAFREQDGVCKYAEVTDYGSRGCEFDELFELLHSPEIAGSQRGRLLTIEHIGLRLKHEGEIEAATACIAHCEKGYQLIGHGDRAAAMSDTLARIYLNQERLADALDACERGDAHLGMAGITAEEGSTEEMRIKIGKSSHRLLRYQVHSAVKLA